MVSRKIGGERCEELLRESSAKNGNVVIESTIMRSICVKAKLLKRVSFVSHLLLLSLLISFTTSASTALAVASLFSKPPLKNGVSTRWESRRWTSQPGVPKTDFS